MMRGGETGNKTIHVFDLGDYYAFSHYFDRQDLFEALSAYYNSESYLFEMTESELEDVREILEESRYVLKIIEDLEPYCVVKEQYTEHADILRESVANWTRNGYHFFIMKDERSVEYAIEQGATPVAESDMVVGI